ncbi:MAG: hypothetical protein LBE76_01985 [Nitrososphaerota archaeon]|jgi:hypothetical protein|nr:hypothetical protein [Nitrososphaerota archaeon]
MVEEINNQRLQERVDDVESMRVLQVQLAKVKRIIYRGQLYVLFAGIFGAVFLCLFTIFFHNNYGRLFGFAIFGVCVAFCSMYNQNAKTEYNKLLEQLQQTHCIQKQTK